MFRLSVHWGGIFLTHKSKLSNNIKGNRIYHRVHDISLLYFSEATPAAIAKTAQNCKDFHLHINLLFHVGIEMLKQQNETIKTMLHLHDIKTMLHLNEPLVGVNH